LKIVTPGKQKCFSPPDVLYRGSIPGPRWGTSVTQTPYIVQFSEMPCTQLHGRLQRCFNRARDGF